jgi:hypothetical protein
MKTSNPVILANGAGDVTTLHFPQTTGGELRAKSFPSDLLGCPNYTEALPLITGRGLTVVYISPFFPLPCLCSPALPPPRVTHTVVYRMQINDLRLNKGVYGVLRWE